jgi:hypothetical protein
MALEEIASPGGAAACGAKEEGEELGKGEGLGAAGEEAVVGVPGRGAQAQEARGAPGRGVGRGGNGSV